MKEPFNSSRRNHGDTLSRIRELDPAKLLAVLVLLIYLPALVSVALLVIFTSAGPAFTKRTFVRPNGQTVDLWVFRTECWERREPTWVGRALDQTSIVRMPALVNVLRGDIEAGERVEARA
jgi:lipopolysaccharide/colanic/teichoic acid biosynthesis glycosyltransferase